MKKTQVKFRVLRLEDTRSEGSELEVGNIFTGELEGTRVAYTDKTGDGWLFYLGPKESEPSCELLE